MLLLLLLLLLQLLLLQLLQLLQLMQLMLLLSLPLRHFGSVLLLGRLASLLLQRLARFLDGRPQLPRPQLALLSRGLGGGGARTPRRGRTVCA